MGIPTFLRPKSLLKLTRPELACLLNDVVKKSPSVEEVTALNTVISELVTNESLPSSIYAVWLPIALRYAPELLRTALSNPHSHGIRQAGIYALARAFHAKDWKQAWDILGGADGLMSIICELSLVEVHGILEAITKCKYATHRAEILPYAEELVRVLDNHPVRPLGLLTTKLLPVCGPGLVQQKLAAIQETIRPDLIIRRIATFHASLLRRIAVGTVEVPLHVRNAVIAIACREMVRCPEPYELVHSESLPSGIEDPRVAFCLDLFHVLKNDEKLLLGQQHVARYLDVALRLVKRGSIPFQYIMLMSKASLPMVIKHTTDWRASPTQELVRYWSVAVKGSVSDGAKLIAKRHAGHHYSCRPRAEHREVLEAILAQLLRDHPNPMLDPQQDRNKFFDAVRDYLTDVAPTARLDFLQLLCQHTKHLSYNLRSDVPCDREKALMPVWPVQILHMLPAKDARYLFNRSLDIYGCTEFLPGTKTDKHGMGMPAQHVLKAKWEAETGANDYPQTRKALEEMKSRTQKRRDPALRLKGVKSTMILAVESSSMEIFHSVLRWMKNFIRETTLFPDIINKMIISPEVGILLSCFDVPGKDPQCLSELAGVVTEAHKALDTLLELALSWLKEPTNPPDMVNKIPALFCVIVHRRIIGCAKYRRRGLGTAAELTNTLLYSLIPVILRYERAAYDNERKNVCWPTVFGFLTGLEVPPDPLNEVVTFMDDLAQQREQLCQHERKTRRPDILTLDNAWPRGLAIQHLMPSMAWAQVALDRPDHAPFLAARVDEVIFAPVDVLMRPRPKDAEYIGRMVDDMYYAVEVYPGHGTMPQRISRMQKITSHYEKVLAEHLLYLSSFKSWLYQHPVLEETPRIMRSMRCVHPVVPLVASYLNDKVAQDEVVEWDPHSGKPYDEPSEETDDTVMMCRLRGKISRPRVTAIDNPAINGPWWRWPSLNHQLRVCKGVSLATAEAITLSAILLLESFTNQRVLQGPFPGEPFRYPPIYLEGQFVNVMQKDPVRLLHRVPSVLTQFANTIPAGLLKSVCNSVLDRIADMDTTTSTYAALLNCAVRLVNLLSRGDKPDSAMGLVWRILADLPDESSYHREMGIADIASRLHPDDAKIFIDRCIGIICEGHSSQPAAVSIDAKQGEDEEISPSEQVTGHPDNEHGPGATSKPENGQGGQSQAGEISTAKQLANILGHANFLSAHTILTGLETLFARIAHIHVRAEILWALLVVLEKDIASERVYNLLASLSKLASGPSEDTEVSENDWIAAETGDGPLPPVTPERQRTLLNMFVVRAFYKLPDRHLIRYMDGVLLPMLDESTTQHTRWMKAFLSRLGLPAEVDVSQYPFGPFDSDILNLTLLEWKKYLPATFLEQHRAVSLSHVHHKTLTTITTHLAHRNSEFRQTNEGRHWLECIRKYREPLTFTNLQLLFGQRGLGPKVPNGLTAEVLGAEYRLRARELIISNEAYSRARDRFVTSVDTVSRALWDLRWKRDAWAKEGIERMYRILQSTMEGIVEDIEAFRTESWKASFDRRPVLLPGKLHLRTILLPSPSHNPTNDNPVKEFVDRVLELLRMCAEDSLLLLDVESIKHVVRLTEQDKCRDSALLIGDVDGVELIDCLRVQLAQDMLRGMSPQDIWLDGELQAMISRWKASPAEFIRSRGWYTE